MELQAKIKEKEKETWKPGVRKKEMIELKMLQEQMHCYLNKEKEKFNC